jgi:preprotein translocase subunit SecF
MIDFLGKKYYFFGLSILFILAGVIAYFIHGGFNLDIQFQGGSVIQIQTNDDKYSTSKAQEVVKNAINKESLVQKLATLDTQNDGKKIYLMQISISSEDTLKSGEQTKLIDAFKADKEFSIKEGAQISSRNVQPSMGAELLRKGVLAVIVSSLIIILYIWWRFQVMSGLSAGIMAILALFHDILLMLSLYAILQIRLNEAFIAAVLTVIGYSMNDTIIIYDRIRENSNQIRKTGIAELVNRSINQTLSRSINTVVTVLICVITVFIFAKSYNIQSIAEFAEPLIIGLASGCYSSIFIASPLWVLWKEYQQKKNIKVKSVKA